MECPMSSTVSEWTDEPTPANGPLLPGPDAPEHAPLSASEPGGNGVHGTSPAPAPAAPGAPARRIAWWEPAYVFFVTFIIFALLTPRIVTYLTPLTGDEIFYLMTDISLWNDHDPNE